jgi:hypothetical protein
LRRNIEARAKRELQRQIEREALDFAVGAITYDDLSPISKSMVDELIAERRREKEKEEHANNL